MKQLLAMGVLLLLATSLTGCGDDSPVNPTLSVQPLTQETADRLAGPLSYLGFALASATEGHSFLDNYFPTARRGGAFYRNTDTGRTVTLSGCDLGGGVVVEGEGELVWVGPGLASERERFCNLAGSTSCLDAFRWQGTLSVTLDRSTVIVINGFQVSDLATVGDTPISAAVSFDGYESSIEDETLYREMFEPDALGWSSIPNPSHSLHRLSGADMDRLAFHLGMGLLGVLVGELDYSTPHSHELDCGNVDVDFDENQLPTLAFSLSDCRLWAGLLLGGEFSTGFGELDIYEPDIVIEVVTSGALSLGGGLPTLELTEWIWRVVAQDAEGEITVSMTLTDADETRTYSKTILVDD